MDVSQVEVGYKLPVMYSTDGESEYQKGEILGIKEENGVRMFYVHYIDFNRRLDGWVGADRLKLDRIEEIEAPKRKRKTESAARRRDTLRAKKGKGGKTDGLQGSSSCGITVAGGGTNVADGGENTQPKNPSRSKTAFEDDLYKIKNVKKIQIGKYLVDAWYFSPYPEEVAKSNIVYICEFCLFYFGSKSRMDSHYKKCKWRHPPGNEIYRKGDLSFFELDGHMQKNYCRDLSLLSKLFLDHKTLYYDVDVFMFYVLCRYTGYGYELIGYFSKEKYSEHGYNLACIMTLPYEQRKGYGKVLMDLSYALSRRENVVASPEKPLSDLGLLGYRSYWTESIVRFIMNLNNVSIKEISLHTSITEEDIISTLVASSILQFYDGVPAFILSKDVVDRAIKSEVYRIDQSRLKWECPTVHFVDRNE